jgi:hypothetical protein
MLRISLSGPPNRRKQPERYVQYPLKFFEELCQAASPLIDKIKNWQ